MRKCKQFFSAPVDHVSNAVQAAIKVLKHLYPIRFCAIIDCLQIETFRTTQRRFAMSKLLAAVDGLRNENAQLKQEIHHLK
jgi:hypothetical protein